MKKQHPTFDEFPAVDLKAWKEAATSLLKGADPEAKLSWSAVKNIDLKAYYDRSVLHDLTYLENTHQIFPIEPWVQYERIVILNEREANEHGKAALMNGCDGVLFKGNLSQVDLNKLLDGIVPEHCFIAFEQEGDMRILDGFPEKIKGFGKNLENRTPTFRNLFIEPAITAGDVVEESSSIIKQVIDLLSGKKPVEVFSNLVISFKPGNDFFHEIARLRAVRILVAHIASYSGTKNTHIHIHTEPKPGKTESDHLLKQTTTGLACIVGGTNSITFHPGESSWAGNGAHRISRNIGNLIRHEAKLDIMKDFSHGAYFIDALTDKLARAIWDQVNIKE